eukprot:CAMPEP_0196807376 /NCGR_PEP_ID=MMETSP1362-20130617/7356_1 /TAXON_ID=163516 /ORGANISM="Leptocylindrus danicus, Strain CCMP1856" /LENGTH=335 /DNA_ID=CAMNT_0042181277 /DNA_START=233 /DNA_END=1240 /DNA_ORIENTATION=+
MADDKESSKIGAKALISIFFAALFCFVVSWEQIRPIDNNNRLRYGFLVTQKQTAAEPAEPTRQDNPILPKRLISIFGLESSGTRYLTETIAKATGASENRVGLNFDGRKDGFKGSRGVEVQHWSLPYGSTCGDRFYTHARVMNEDFLLNYATVSTIPPRECGVTDTNGAVHGLLWDEVTWHNSSRVLPQYCRDAGLEVFTTTPARFFVNITSHIQWHLDRGVQATALIIARDKNIERMSKIGGHCNNEIVAELEDMHGTRIMLEALDKLETEGDMPSVVLVSYELLNLLGEPYMLSIYKKLGIESTFVAPLKDGNTRYINNSGSHANGGSVRHYV